MIIELKDKCSGYSELYREHFNHKHKYTIDTEKVVYISDGSYHEGREECTIHFISGTNLKIYNHSYEDVVNMIYGTDNNKIKDYNGLSKKSTEELESMRYCIAIGGDVAKEIDEILRQRRDS